MSKVYRMNYMMSDKDQKRLLSLLPSLRLVKLLISVSTAFTFSLSAILRTRKQLPILYNSDIFDSLYHDRVVFAHPLPTKGSLDNNDNTCLHLVVCESRENGTHYQYWNKSAHRFQQMNHLENEKFSNAIRIVNVCSGVKWKGFVTKTIELKRYITEIVNQTASNEEASPLPSDNSTLGFSSLASSTRHIVLFSDSDSYFNSYAGFLPQIINEYDKARNGKPLLLSAEPVCWIGFRCTEKQMQEYYPQATNRSSCPQFVNAGQYMGEAGAMLHMLTTMLSYNIKDDQHSLAKYQRYFAERVQLDIESMVLRGMALGLINHEILGGRTCGAGDGIKSCGANVPPPPAGHIETDIGRNGSKELELFGPRIAMAPVKDCVAGRYPFNIHFPGRLNRKFVWPAIVQGMDDAVSKLY